MCDIQFSMVTSVITAAGLIVYGSKENKAILRHLALIHRKAASSLFLKHESPFAGCGVWRVAEVKGAGTAAWRAGSHWPWRGEAALHTLRIGLESELQSGNRSKSDVTA